MLVTESGQIQFPSRFSEMSNFVKHAIEDFPGEIQVKLPIEHLELIHEYAVYHNCEVVRIEGRVSGKKFSEVFKDEWDQSFLKRLRKKIDLSEFILSVVYLDVAGLLDMLFAFIAWEMTCEMTNEHFDKIKRRFNINAEFTEEEELKIFKLNPWANM